MIQIKQKKDCCGCNSCAEKCPKQCIRMKEDTEGFLYPSVQIEKCVDCGICEKVCPILQKDFLYHADTENTPRAVGGWHKDSTVRANSSSGGAFTLFASHILEMGGIVYGAEMDENIHVKHIGVDSYDGLQKLRGSKYVQSNIGNVYSQIEKYLKQNRKVLFSGTPCQTAGLNAFLQKKYDNLYTVDFVCHGVPSPKVFSSYVQHLEHKYNDRIVAFKFRTKDHGWHPSGVQLGSGSEIITENGTRIRHYPAFRDHYMNGFSDDIYLRPSCYDCRFKCLPKYYSDITIADFWGVKKIDPELFDGKGTSLILLNNRHGFDLFEKTKGDFFYKECSFKQAIKRNQSLIKSVSWNPRRDNFFEDYEKLSFKAVILKYMTPFSWGLHKIMKILWSIFERTLKKVAYSLLQAVHIQWTEERWDKWMQFVRFALVGMTNVFVSYSINIGTLALLRGARFDYDYVIANTTAFLLSVLWSYYWNSRLVFTISSGEKRSKTRTLLKTYAAYAFTGLFLNNIMATFWIYVINVPKYISPILNLPVTIPINYLTNKFWAYKKGEKVKT